MTRRLSGSGKSPDGHSLARERQSDVESYTRLHQRLHLGARILTVIACERERLGQPDHKRELEFAVLQRELDELEHEWQAGQ